MDTVPENLSEELVEFEDVQLSDNEESENPIELAAGSVNIDYSSRITSTPVHCEPAINKIPDQQFCENQSYSYQLKTDRDSAELTSSEEFEVSDVEEEKPSFKVLTLQSTDTEGVASVAGKRTLQASSSIDYSSTSFKEEECLTDNEYLSDEEMNTSRNNSVVNGKPECHENRKLSFGLSVSELLSTVKDVFSGRQTTLSTLSVTNPFSSNLEIKKDLPKTTAGEVNSPMMTCLEFLQSNPSEDELTDVEDVSAESPGSNKPSMTFDLEEAMRYRGKIASQGLDINNQDRRSSWTTEYLSDDETSLSDTKNLNDSSSHARHSKRRSSISADCNDGTLTDEELVDINVGD